MAKKVEKKALKKVIAKYNLIGEAVVNDYTFKLDQESTKSDWLYSILNLNINCGDGNKVFCESMGGYGTERDNILYVHGRKPQLDANKEPKTDKNGDVMMTDDFDNRFTIDFEDRLDEDIIADIGDLCFMTVGLEQTETKKKDKDGNPIMQTIYEKFLSSYDAIEYISEHLEDGMVINVSGNIKYQEYEGSTTIKKEITSIALSKATPDKYKATFQQTILLDKDSIGKKLNKENNSFDISARVLDYSKFVIDGKEVYKGNIPFFVNYEVLLDEEKPERTKMFLDKVLKVRKDITELTVEGNIIEGSSLLEVKDEDIDPEILLFIEQGILDRDDIVGKMSAGSKKTRRWVIVKPMVKNVKKGEDTKLVVLKTEMQYTEDDLDVIPFTSVDEEDIPFEKENKKAKTKSKVEESDDDDEDEEDDGMDWLNALTDDDEEEETKLPFK